MPVPYRRASCDARFLALFSTVRRTTRPSFVALGLTLAFAFCQMPRHAAAGEPPRHLHLAHSTAIISGGSVTGTPSDNPTKRIDPNVPASPFAGVGSLNAFGFSSTATVLDTYHIVCAAHSVTDASDGHVNTLPQDVGFFLNSDGDQNLSFHATAIDVSPEWHGFNNTAFYGNGARYGDVAVITLDNPIPDSVPRYALHDSLLTAGDEITMVGYGQGGYGDTGYDSNAPATFKIKRKGKNNADAFSALDANNQATDITDANTSSSRIFYADFDGPTSATNLLGGPTLGNDVEATLGAGDSGSPSFVLVNGHYELAAVNTFTAQFTDNNGVTYAAAPLFGSGFGGQLISAYAPFIRAHTSAIPEAGTVVTLGLGLLALGGALWRRRK